MLLFVPVVAVALVVAGETAGCCCLDSVTSVASVTLPVVLPVSDEPQLVLDRLGFAQVVVVVVVAVKGSMLPLSSFRLPPSLVSHKKT